MTSTIRQLSGADAYALIHPEHLAQLPALDQETMRRVMTNSTMLWIGCVDDDPLCVYGLTAPTFLSDRAYLWLWTTSHFDRHVFTFIRHSQRVVEDMLRHYPTIVGHGQVGADRSLRWLRWLGAEFGTPQGQLLPFTITAKESPWQRQQA